MKTPSWVLWKADLCNNIIEQLFWSSLGSSKLRWFHSNVIVQLRKESNSSGMKWPNPKWSYQKVTGRVFGGGGDKISSLCLNTSLHVDNSLGIGVSWASPPFVFVLAKGSHSWAAESLVLESLARGTTLPNYLVQYPALAAFLRLRMKFIPLDSRKIKKKCPMDEQDASFFLRELRSNE